MVLRFTISMFDHQLKSEMTRTIAEMHANYVGCNPYSTCVLCGLNKNIMSNRGQASGIKLFFGYHNNALVGISRCYLYKSIITI